MIGSGVGTVTPFVNETDYVAVDSTNDKAFRWDPTGRQWILNMDSKNLAADITYLYRVTLNDDSWIDFQVGIRAK